MHDQVQRLRVLREEFHVNLLCVVAVPEEGAASSVHAGELDGRSERAIEHVGLRAGNLGDRHAVIF